jgi:hypothetical protein
LEKMNMKMQKKKSLPPVAKIVPKTKKTVLKAVEPERAAPSKKRRLATLSDLVEVQDPNLLVSIDLKRQSTDTINQTEIEEGQRLFPYSVASRFMIGWHQVSHISSFELKMSSEYPLPTVVVRFVEKMPKGDIEKMDPALREHILSQIAIVRQYPFVTVECPLLDGGVVGVVSNKA